MISTLKVHPGKSLQRQNIRICRGFNFQFRMDDDWIKTIKKSKKKGFQLTRLKTNY